MTMSGKFIAMTIGFPLMGFVIYCTGQMLEMSAKQHDILNMFGCLLIVIPTITAAVAALLWACVYVVSWNAPGHGRQP